LGLDPILLREGKTQQATYYFDLEEKSYPESKVFIERLKNFTTTKKEE
jgi:hypothetical protein